MTTLSFPFTVVLFYAGRAQVHTTDATDPHAAAHRFTHHPATGERYRDGAGQPDAVVLAVFAGHHTNLWNTP